MKQDVITGIMRIGRRCRKLGVLLAAFFAVSHEAIAQVWSHDPAAAQACGTIALSYAAHANETDFSTAITNGQVVVVPGEMGGGAISGTIFPSGGGPAIIVVPNGGSTELIGAAALHEWQHAKHGDTPQVNGQPLTASQLQAVACQELAAHCATMMDFSFMNTEHGTVMSCTLKDMILGYAEWEALYCTWGVGVDGPPAPNPCTSLPNVPCC